MLEYARVAELADKYDGFILDIWGVIHDGEKAYRGAVEAVRELQQRGKEIIFLSNAPRRADKVKRALAKFGVTEDLYKAAVSSGEVAYNIFAAQQKSAITNYFYIGPDKDADLLHGLNYQAVETAAQAEFVLATGFDQDDSMLAEKLPQINAALAANLKMYCVNPDLIVVRQNGGKLLCAGVIGEYYAEQGGVVEFIGKPYPAVYQHVFKIFSPKISSSRLVAIGDGLGTDIKGANSVNIESILVLGGILQAEKESLPELIEKRGVTPYATLPQFSW